MFVSFFTGLAAGLGVGFLAGHQFASRTISGLKEARTIAEKKLADIGVELALIEQQADRRIVPAIHKVTARIKGVL